MLVLRKIDEIGFSDWLDIGLREREELRVFGLVRFFGI